MRKRIAAFFVFVSAITSSVGFASESYFDSDLKMVICKEPLPEFTLSETSQPTATQVIKLCSCVWNTFPSGGWEQQTSQQLRNGKNAGWRTRAFISRFGAAMERCGAYGL